MVGGGMGFLVDKEVLLPRGMELDDVCGGALLCQFRMSVCRFVEPLAAALLPFPFCRLPRSVMRASPIVAFQVGRADLAGKLGWDADCGFSHVHFSLVRYTSDIADASRSRMAASQRLYSGR